MIYGSSKRIVVVRNIPSNVIEEAILILKHEPDNESTQKVSGKTPKKDSGKINNAYLLKEAETIINSYINENKLEEKYPRKVVISKGIFSKSNKWANVFLNTGLVISIAILIFVLSRLM